MYLSVRLVGCFQCDWLVSFIATDWYLSVRPVGIFRYETSNISSLFVRSVQGRKIICLCISEPWAASDVAGLQTTAEKQV